MGKHIADKKELKPDEQSRFVKLMRGTKDRMTSKYRKTSKRETKRAITREMKKKAIENGEDPSSVHCTTSPHVHWDKSMKQYIAIASRYINWLVRTHPDVWTLNYALEKGCVREFIQFLIDGGMAAGSIQTYRSALAKVFGVDGVELHESVPKRCSAEFTKSRSYTPEKCKADFAKHGLPAELARMTGMRRESLATVRKRNFIEDSDGNIYLFLGGHKSNGKTKGGKPIHVIILPKYHDRIREILKDFEADELLCPKPPKHMCVHGMRSLYAEELYANCARKIEDIPWDERVKLKNPRIDDARSGKIRYDAPAIFRRRHDGREFDRVAFRIVSESLGHGPDRVDVISNNYLWRSEAPES